MKPLRIWLVGMGTVGTWLADVLAAAGQVTVTGPGAGPQLAGQGVLSDIIALASRRAARA